MITSRLDLVLSFGRMRTISQTCSESKPEEEEHFTSKGLTEAVVENAGLDSA